MRPDSVSYVCKKRSLRIRPEIVETAKMLVGFAVAGLLGWWVAWQIWASGLWW